MTYRDVCTKVAAKPPARDDVVIVAEMLGYFVFLAIAAVATIVLYHVG